jgi:hypothetical protein
MKILNKTITLKGKEKEDFLKDMKIYNKYIKTNADMDKNFEIGNKWIGILEKKGVTGIKCGDMEFNIGIEVDEDIELIDKMADIYGKEVKHGKEEN